MDLRVRDTASVLLQPTGEGEPLADRIEIGRIGDTAVAVGGALQDRGPGPLL